MCWNKHIFVGSTCQLEERSRSSQLFSPTQTPHLTSNTRLKGLRTQACRERILPHWSKRQKYAVCQDTLRPTGPVGAERYGAPAHRLSDTVFNWPSSTEMRGLVPSANVLELWTIPSLGSLDLWGPSFAAASEEPVEVRPAHSPNSPLCCRCC